MELNEGRPARQLGHRDADRLAVQAPTRGHVDVDDAPAGSPAESHERRERTCKNGQPGQRPLVTIGRDDLEVVALREWGSQKTAQRSVNASGEGRIRTEVRDVHAGIRRR
jgi:hypothetical protein